MRRMICCTLVLILMSTLIPVSVLACNGDKGFERILSEGELALIIGLGGSGGGNDDDGGNGGGGNKKSDEKWKKNYTGTPTMEYGIADLIFFQNNYSSVPIEVGRKQIDSWTISGTISGSAKIKSIFETEVSFMGTKKHTEETSTSFTIPANYCMKIYTKPYRKKTPLHYEEWERKNGVEKCTFSTTGTHTYKSKVVSYQGHTL